jgi:uncharacterized protein
MIIILAGGTGLIGTRLSQQLTNAGHTVRILTRSPRGAAQFHWNPFKGTIDHSVFDGADAVINLAGSGIADRRWTAARKRDLIESRTQSIQTLQQALLDLQTRPAVFVSASAVGIYGNSGEEWQFETTPVRQGKRDFMVECCDQWEQAADTVAALGIRTVKVRIGVVLAQEGGALREMAKPIRFGLGAYFGNGQMWMPWIALDDICQMLQWAAETPSVEGVFNGVSPNPARNVDLTKATAKAMGRWAAFLPAPAFVLRLLLGEMSAVVLNSNRVSANKVLEAGFKFESPTLETALERAFRPV